MTLDVAQLLLSVPPFMSLPVEEIRNLSTRVSINTYPSGTYIFRQGDESTNTLYIIVNGSADVLVSNDDGIDTIVSHRDKYDFFGETVLLTGEYYPGTVRGREELTCLLIPASEVERLVGQFPEFSGYFTSTLLDRMRSLYEEIVNEQSFDAYSHVDTPLFRKRISEIMSTPVVTCLPTDNVIKAAGIMSEKKISAVVVTDEQSRPLGMLSSNDLTQKIIAQGISNYGNVNVGAVMSGNLVSIQAESFYHQALLSVAKNQIKHLAVTRGDRLVGIVTTADLIKTRSTGSLLVTHDIESQRSLEGLAMVGREVDNILNALVAEKAPVPEILNIMSEFHDRLTRRVIHLCEDEMVSRGRGIPPVEYCWINMGSAGRREQTLRTDQDNAVIYADAQPGEEEQVKQYFYELTALINDGLEKCGFVKCPGNVMASNPMWCRSLAEWLAAVRKWGEGAGRNTDYVRVLTILLDFRPVYGDYDLSTALWDEVFATCREYVAITHFLTQDDMKARVPISMWGGLQANKSGPYKDQINLKNAASVHIVNCMRIFALSRGLINTSTFGRLKALARNGAIDNDDIDFIRAAFETLLMFRIRENIRKVKRGEKANDYVNVSRLTKRERQILRDAFSAVSRLQKLTSAEFNIMWLR